MSRLTESSFLEKLIEKSLDISVIENDDKQEKSEEWQIDGDKLILQVIMPTGFNADTKRDKALKECATLIEEFYNPNGTMRRHRYSEVSRFISDNEIGPQLAETCKVLIGSYQLNSSYFTDTVIATECVNRLWKIKDHIDLEIFRQEKEEFLKRDFLSEVDEVRLVNKSLKKELDSTLITLTDAKDLAEKATEQAKNQESLSLTIMGIFAGVVMVFSGSITILGGAFSEINTTASFARLFVLTSLIGIILIDGIFGFVYLISKLIDKPIRTRCRKTKEGSCNCVEPYTNDKGQIVDPPCAKCNFFAKLYRRYSYIMVPNLVVTVGIAVVSLIQMFSHQR